MTAGLFHVIGHSIRSVDLFRDDMDRVIFLRELARAGDKARWTCLAFCLMTTHYHLLLEVGDGALPVGMQALNFRYACGFNARHGVRGHLFAARYYAVRILNDSHLMVAYRYVARNPLAARLCEAAGDWPWGSYRATAGITAEHSFVDASRVLGCFSDWPEIARPRLRTFVESS